MEDDHEIYSGENEQQEDIYDSHAQLLQDLRDTFETPHGKRVLADLMVFSQIDGEAFTGNSKTFYLLGLQAYGKRVKGLIEEASPALAVEVYRMMLIGERQKARG